MMQKMVSVTNRRLKLVLNLVLFSAFVLVSGAYAQSCPVGLIGYWKLDDSGLNMKYQDYINAPNGNDGICDTDCPTQLTHSESVVTAAQLFDGLNDGITVPAAATFDWSAAASFSIELWVKKDSAVAAGGEVLVARKDPDSQMLWKIELTQAGTAKFTLISTSGEGAAYSASGSKIVNTGRWHHIVAMRDAVSGANLIYVDGQYDGGSSAVTYSAGFDSAAAGPTMGWIDDAGQQERFSGSLDEVAFYSRALSDTEIATHYYLAKGYCNLYDTKTRVLPLGDSITYGFPTTNSYRQSLWNAMVADSFYMDFVGSENNGTGGFDMDHAGFGGLTCSGLYSIMSTGYNPDESSFQDYPGQVTTGAFLNTRPADVVLLHIGTNDLTSSFNASQTVDQVENVLNQIDAYSESVTVILALIINRANGGNHAYTTLYNDAIYSMAQARIENGDKIIIVDMERNAGLVYSTSVDFNDELHPNDSGYTKVGAAWLTELETFMPRFEAPLIHDAATPLVATLGRPFAFTVESDAAPAPNYNLIAQPSGMTIDSNTGVVSWTPALQTTGPVSFSVRAANMIPTGTIMLNLTTAEDTHSFDVALNHAPNAAAEAYTTAEDGSLNIDAASGVLANDTDPDSDPLSTVLVNTTAHGTLSLNSDGSFTYSSDGSGATADSFIYQADDGHAASTATTVNITITQSNNTGGTTGGGGSGGGCFIGAIGIPASGPQPWIAWTALLFVCLATGFRQMRCGGQQNRPGHRSH